MGGARANREVKALKGLSSSWGCQSAHSLDGLPSSLEIVFFLMEIEGISFYNF